MKRTCGGCDRFARSDGVRMGKCQAPAPMWVIYMDDAMRYEILGSANATHCETFKLKKTRKDDE